MSFDWQTWSALAVVAVSFAVLWRRAVSIARGKATSSCSSCPNSSTPPLVKTLPLVQLGAPSRSKSHD